jgi:fatty-acyl-CoA synthase
MKAAFSPSYEKPSRAWLRALEIVARATQDPHRILPRAVDEWGERYGEKPALMSQRETFTFAELAERKTVYARWALKRGLARGETVALMMRNRPDYFALWLGLCEVGVVAALVSPDLAAPALAHALKVSRAKLLIVDPALVEVARAAEIEVLPHEGAGSLREALKGISKSPLGENERRKITLDDRALRIFTSGTTGMPKAAEVSHRRIVVWSHWFAGLAGFGAEDRHYNSLPMHHSVGGVVALGAPLVRGGSVVITERFTASRFFDDVVRWQCTSFQYIGELCRYLIAAPPSEAEKHHQLRLALGNGIAPDVWRAMRERFGDLRVLEFYASTEGNVWLYNVEGRIGALGRVPPHLAARETIALAKFDLDAQAPLRGEDGFCLRCGDDEIGEALGRIGDEPQQRFEGYSESQETEKKILRNVFKQGDAWMRTGDLMRRDADGFYYFVDRIGDTFRWKGENVATLEVAKACLAQVGVDDALVFGVAVPGAEGRAGMALIKTLGGLDLARFARGMEVLPRYARPLFLRLTQEIATTETLKPKRGAYIAEGFDPAKSEDPLYVFDSEAGAYAALDSERHAAIVAGELKL